MLALSRRIRRELMILRNRLANVAGTSEPIYGPTAVQPVTKQAETTPYTEVERKDMKWLNMDSTSVETQTFYLHADSGHISVAQIIHSNVAYVPECIRTFLY
jgi:hypothetical protein